MDIELEHVQILRPQEGDVIVYRIDKMLSVDTAVHIHRALHELFPDNVCGIIDGGGELVIIRPEDATT
jgi:hypothetical protein